MRPFRVPVLAAFAALVPGALSAAPAKPAPAARPALSAAPAKPAQPAPPATRVALAPDYLHDVSPLLGGLGCAQVACHGGGAGKGGLKLSLFGADPDADYAALSDVKRPRFDHHSADGSLILQKIAARTAHGGGVRAAVGSPEFLAIRAWIAGGGAYSTPGRPALTSIAIAPATAALKRGATLSPRVIAAYSDGSRRDVTRDSQLSCTLAGVVDVNGKTLAARGYGQTFLVAGFGRKFATARIVAPQPLPTKVTTPAGGGEIDRLCAMKWREVGIPPSALASDPTFLRRVSLDTTGLVPTQEAARAFLADRSPDRRAKLIDRLLASPEYVDYVSLKWGDLLRIKSEFPVRLWPKAVETYSRWVHESIAANKPYDQFATELITGTGSDFRSGPANYYRAVTDRDPQSFGETTALLFMGARLGCAHCHGHPSDSWSTADNLGFAAFFAGIKFKPTQEWKEEIVMADPEPIFRNPKTADIILPRIPGEAMPVASSPTESRRAQLAHWLTAPANPWFARSIVNRVWYWLMGRGIVEEPDDMRATNPPVNSALLDYLAKDFTAHGSDIRRLTRTILNSRVYQLSSTPTRWNAADTALFSHYTVKRLAAEPMLDAINQLTGASDDFSSIIPEPFTHMPAGSRAVQITDGSIETAFLGLFGRPARDMAYESDRCSRATARQAMVLLNSQEIESKIASGTRVKRLTEPGRADGAVVEEIYLSALSRLPSASEKQVALAHMARHTAARAEAIQDLVWAIINTREFLFVR